MIKLEAMAMLMRVNYYVRAKGDEEASSIILHAATELRIEIEKERKA